VVALAVHYFAVVMAAAVIYYSANNDLVAPWQKDSGWKKVLINQDNAIQPRQQWKAMQKTK
jgi:hypothetical protein